MAGKGFGWGSRNVRKNAISNDRRWAVDRRVDSVLRRRLNRILLLLLYMLPVSQATNEERDEHGKNWQPFLHAQTRISRPCIHVLLDIILSLVYQVVTWRHTTNRVCDSYEDIARQNWRLRGKANRFNPSFTLAIHKLLQCWSGEKRLGLTI